MTRTSFIALAFSAALFTGACSPSDDTPAQDAAPVPPAPAGDTVDAPEADPGMSTSDNDTMGGDGSEITLQPVRTEDTSDLQGELGCSFAVDGETLLVAMADVDDNNRATGAINNNGYGEPLMGEQLGGFSALEPDGGTFSGRGMVITVETGSDALDGPNTEQVTKAATMTVNRADGAARTYDGEWTCGP